MVTRRMMVGTAVLAPIGLAAGKLDARMPGKTAMPKVTGPVTGGKRGWAFGAYAGDLSALGYVEEEYFLEGMAARYAPVGDLSLEGHWRLRVVDRLPYKTRIVVRRPIDPARFNGTVIVTWTNVSAGFENFGTPGGYDGFAHMAVSTQPTGIDGYQSTKLGLKDWDPDRYGSLFIPDDAVGYDIFTQAARAVGPKRALTGVDPMGGLPVRKLIATGASQSGTRVMAYLNGVQPISQIFDAFVPIVCAGTAADFEPELAHPDPATVKSRNAALSDAEKTDPQAQLKAASASRGHSRSVPTLVRTDLAVPVMPINTETEAFVYYPRRQPETARFCYWEIAGGAHAGGVADPERAARFKRDALSIGGLVGRPGKRRSEVDTDAVYDAAMHHVHRWITTGQAPTRQPPMDIGGTPLAIRRDAHGNALGGIRLPELEAPVATYHGMDDHGSIGGETIPFPPEELKTLYPTHADYVAKVKAAADRAVAAGVILPARGVKYIADAEAAPIPPA